MSQFRGWSGEKKNRTRHCSQLTGTNCLLPNNATTRDGFQAEIEHKSDTVIALGMERLKRLVLLQDCVISSEISRWFESQKLFNLTTHPYAVLLRFIEEENELP